MAKAQNADQTIELARPRQRRHKRLQAQEGFLTEAERQTWDTWPHSDMLEPTASDWRAHTHTQTPRKRHAPKRRGRGEVQSELSFLCKWIFVLSISLSLAFFLILSLAHSPFACWSASACPVGGAWLGRRGRGRGPKQTSRSRRSLRLRMRPECLARRNALARSRGGGW